MKQTIALAASAMLALGACREPTAPPASGPAAARRTTVSATPGDALLFRPCVFDWTSESYFGVLCNLKVRNADGIDSYAVGYTDRLYVWPGAQQSWTADGSRIAYAAWTDDGLSDLVNADIFVVTLADGSAVNLTSHPAADRSPAWSPDGARIAFLSDRDGGTALYLMSADGSGVTRLAGGIGRVSRPAWSPDGARIAYTCAVDAGNDDICAIGADGTGLARLTSSPAADYDPDFSPDGARIAFATTRFEPTVRPQIAVMDADGANVARISVNISSAEQPAWSPSGDRIAFVRWGASACNDFCDNYVYVMNADGSGVTVVANGNGPDWAGGIYVPPPADYPPPVAIFTERCAGLTCAFDGTASYSAHYNIMETWVFGDGADAQNDNTPTHTYAAAGTYLVVLSVRDELGQVTTARHEVTVTAPPPPPPPDLAPVARFTFACTYLGCAFDGGTSTDDHGIAGRVWTFGDGQGASGTFAPSHDYGGAGTYQVTLAVTDSLGQTGTVTQSVTVIAPPPPPPPDAAPVARFTASCTGLACAFQSDASSDDHRIVSRAWTFGDGSSGGDAVAPGHSYGAGGTYQVTLTVTDDAGQIGTVTHAVTAVDRPPVARFVWSCAGSTCTLDARSSTDDLGIVSYAWDLGSRLGTASGAVVTAQFRGKSSQLVTLTVKDGSGQTSSVSQTIVTK